MRPRCYVALHVVLVQCDCVLCCARYVQFWGLGYSDIYTMGVMRTRRAAR